MTARACFTESSPTMGGGVRLGERSAAESSGSGSGGMVYSSSSLESVKTGLAFFLAGADFLIVLCRQFGAILGGEYVCLRGWYSLVLSSEPAEISTCGKVKYVNT